MSGETAWPPPPQEGMPSLRRALVDVEALRANTATVAAALGPGVALMAVVKGNGYGHGAVLCAREALGAGATWLGVSSAQEALQLRGAGIDAPVLLTGWTHPATLPALVAAGVDVALTEPSGVDAATAAAAVAGRPALVQLKLDTGMHRQGMAPEAVPAALRALAAAGPGRVELRGVFTHLAAAEADDPAFALEQHALLLDAATAVRRQAPGALVHCANSTAALRLPELRDDLCRVGLALYGVTPEHAPSGLGLRPVMSLRALVTGLRTIRAGESVGYGLTWTAARTTRVATVGAGYADGIARAQQHGGAVLLGGVRCPVVGRVSMDQLSVDATGVEGLRVGDEAVLVGWDDAGGVLDAAEVAAVEGTIAYEVLVRVSARVPRQVAGRPSIPGGSRDSIGMAP